MAHTPKVLAQVLLAATETTIYTAAAGVRTTLTALLVVNNDVATRTYTLHLAAGTVAVGNVNALAVAGSIAANTSTAFPVAGMLMPEGYVLSGLASVANTIGIQLFGIETT